MNPSRTPGGTPAAMVDRRAFLGRLLAGSAAAFGAAVLPAREAQLSPNILIVLTDDQGWGDIHSHNNEAIETPVMDRLAMEGARFERFYVSPVCAPTRAALLTGHYYLRTGVTGVTHGKEIMRSEEMTLAEVLRQAGYATGCFGKWHNGAHYPCHPNGQGFEEFFGFCGGHWNNYFDTTLEHNGEPVETKGYINDVVTAAALNFIEKNRERPFLCYVPYNTPHSPFQVPDSYFDACKDRGLDDVLATVYGMCRNLDDNLGRLLRKLDKLNLTDNTIVVFFGDNGPNTERYNGGMRGRKGSVHEGGVRNSLFMRWPGHIPAGSRIEPICAAIDLMPTLLEFAGLSFKPKKPMDGISLVPLLTESAPNWPDRMLFSYWAGRGSVRTERYRLFVDKDRTELYDMTEDPGQERDVAADRPEVSGRLRAAYDSWFAEMARETGGPPALPVGYAEMPVVTLPAPECRLHGGVAFQGDKGWANDWITNWTSTEDFVSWDMDVVRAGTYAFTLLYTCSEDDVGAEIAVEVASKRTTVQVTDAHDPPHKPSPDRVPRKEVYEKVWAELAMGQLTLSAGKATLSVKALTIPGKSAMDLKAVRITRLK